MKIGYLRLDPAAVLPTRAHGNDLGIDLYALEDTVLAAGVVSKVRTGIAIQFPANIGGIIKDRSSVATKKGVFTVAGVIDPQYTGEIIVAFFNPGSLPGRFPHPTTGEILELRFYGVGGECTIKAGEKIAQLVLQHAVIVEPEEITEIHDTTRANKGFGSSGV